MRKPWKILLLHVLLFDILPTWHIAGWDFCLYNLSCLKDFQVFFFRTRKNKPEVEKLKKKNDIQTYKEIVAFTEGKKLDELHKAVEVGKRPYQNILKVIISAGVTAMICFLIGVLMHLFLN